MSRKVLLTIIAVLVIVLAVGLACIAFLRANLPANQETTGTQAPGVQQTDAPKQTDAPQQTDAPKQTDVPQQTGAPQQTDAPQKPTDAPQKPTEAPQKQTDAPTSPPRYENVTPWG